MVKFCERKIKYLYLFSQILIAKHRGSQQFPEKRQSFQFRYAFPPATSEQKPHAHRRGSQQIAVRLQIHGRTRMGETPTSPRPCQRPASFRRFERRRRRRQRQHLQYSRHALAQRSHRRSNASDDAARAAGRHQQRDPFDTGGEAEHRGESGGVGVARRQHGAHEFVGKRKELGTPKPPCKR